ncbi:MAG: TIR domain-containing protein [Bryobacteraceae bacterium]
MKTKPQVFFSYAREDQALVEPVYDMLRRSGFVPWMDVRDIGPGEEWAVSIKRAIRRSNFCLAFVSSHSVPKTGVLLEEIRAAREIRTQNLEGETYLIPIRLDATPLPELLAPFQQIDYLTKDGPSRLLQALGYRRSRVPYLAAAVAVVLLGVGAWWFSRPHAQQRFQGIGLTVWNLRPSQPADRPSARVIVHPDDAPTKVSLTPVRIPETLELPKAAKFRLGIETSRDGYLYVIDQEQFGENGLGAPQLIFPTKRLRGGNNHLASAELIEIPAPEDLTPYFELRSSQPDYRGELLTVVITPEPITNLVLDAATLKHWQTTWTVPTRRIATGTPGAIPTDTELEARNVLGRRLGQNDPLPALVFTIDAKATAPVMIQTPIRVGAVQNAK